MQAEAERRRSERDQQSQITLVRGKQPDRDSVEQHPSVQDPGAQASAEAEAHKRSTSMSPTVSTRTVKTKEAKDFSKSEAELVDVMDTLQT